MNKSILTFFCIGTFFFSGYGQQQQRELDSLLEVLKTIPKDTTKVLTYSRVSLLYSRTYKNDDLAIKFADSVMALSEELKYERGIAHANYRYGGIDRFQGNYQSALRHFQEFLRYHKKQGDSLKVAVGLYQMGVVYRNLGDLDKSLSAYFRALKIQEKVNNRREIAPLFNSIGNIYRRMNKQNDAISMYTEANEIFYSLKLMKNYAMGLQNIGNAYVTLEKIDSARQKYIEALNIVQDLGEDVETAMVLSNLGSLYQNQGQSEQALSALLRSLAIRRTLPHKRSTAYNLKKIGEVYTKLNKYKEAYQYINEGLKLSREINSKDLLQEFYENFAELYKAQNNFEKAYAYYELSVQMKDSVFNLEKTEVINELQTKYETEKKDQQIALLAKEKEIQEKEIQRQATLKKIFIGGMALLLLIGGLLVYILRQRLKLASKNEEIKEAKFKQKLSNLEMKALQAQVNPHFIFNCLNSINQMITDGEKKNASWYLTKFSKLIRLILESSEDSEVSLKNELAMLEAYIQLEELRFNGKITYNLSIDKLIDSENTYIPSMLLQPFVENAIWHGLMPKKAKENGSIHISVNKDENQLRCSIEDNGIGREKAAEQQQKSVWKSKSMGLKITEERLRLVSEEFQRQLIKITDLKDSVGKALGTRVEVQIPIF